MDDKTKKDFIQLFNQGFEEVVLPQFEILEDEIKEVKQDVKEVKSRLGVVENRLGVVENRLDTVERKLDRVIDNQLDDKGKLADHEKRIKRLESKSVIAS